MPKSLLHFKRHFESIAGPLAKVRAYRAPDAPPQYRIHCGECQCHINDRSGKEFHPAMRMWAAHLRLAHPAIQIAYAPNPPLLGAELAAANRLIQNKIMDDRLMTIFGRRDNTSAP